MNNKLYPLKFEPILKDKIWGGQKLKNHLNKASDLPNVGESWEISDIEGDTSIVSNGLLKGTSLKTLLELYKEDLLGNKNYEVFGNKFPLLIKYIDAKEDLSIQLHPNDELAAKRHNSFGKTEMWYVMQADEDSNLIVGFNKKVSPEEYLQHLEDKTLTSILNFEKVDEGDTFFIEVGRVHAIGAGVMLAEIQQTSDITYRVYDWDRVDAEGNSRELHNDLALDAIDFDMDNDFKVDYDKSENISNLMVDCPYFKTSFLEVTESIQKKNNNDSFYIYMCVDGQVEIKIKDYQEKINKGETILIPASIEAYELKSNNAKLLEVYV
ncbi:type I phosphomannose isomerase catalytic subunit [Winogradskyella sp. 3972H.M.0a.05]|uniref:type I phosphomannose isomerase catalytic subunit n=1 Tax=Winogradskyella sp. 3972H.M.0a.05 TaxID=2950277 RepID=UPI0033925D25